MSFTTNIKNEISNIEYSESEKMAELSAILNIGVKIHEDNFEILSYKKLFFLDNLLHIADNKEHLKKN